MGMSESERAEYERELQEIAELVREASRAAIKSGKIVETLEELEDLPAPVALMTTLLAAAALAVAGNPAAKPLPLELFKGVAAAAWDMVAQAAREKAAERVVDEAVARAQQAAAEGR